MFLSGLYILREQESIVIAPMDGAEKKSLMFMESAQQHLGGGAWLRCATICTLFAIPVENSAVVATTRKELPPFMACRTSNP